MNISIKKHLIMNQLKNQLINQSIDQSINQYMKISMNKQIKQ